MALEERSYSGRLFRPKPAIHTQEDGQLIIVATPWGAKSGGEKTIQSMQEFFLSSRDDQEVTSPFEKLTCLSATANNLRAAVMLTNDVIYQEENRNEYKTGLELFAMARTDREVAWVQIGQPQVFLDREGFPIIPMAGQSDLALDLSASESLLPPLPVHLLGVASTSNFGVYSFRPQPGDRLILLSRTLVPPKFFHLSRRERNTNDITRTLAAADPHSPFWLALLPL